MRLVAPALCLSLLGGCSSAAKKPSPPGMGAEQQQLTTWIASRALDYNTTLTSMLSTHAFVLFGERHIHEVEAVRYKLIAALPALKSAGLEVVGVEIPAGRQKEIDAVNQHAPDAEQQLRRIFPYFYSGNYQFILAAKRLGLQVLCMDVEYAQSAQQRNSALWQNQRDAAMGAALLTATSGGRRKSLTLIGSAHVQEAPVESYSDGSVSRLGARLAAITGREQIASVHILSDEDTVDGLCLSSMPKFRDAMGERFPLPALFKAEGPVRGDPRVMAADYIVVYRSSRLLIQQATTAPAEEFFSSKLRHIIEEHREKRIAALSKENGTF